MVPLDRHLHDANTHWSQQPQTRRQTEGSRESRRGSRQPRPPALLDAGPLGADIGSFRLHLAAEGKAARTVQGYASAVRWFAASYLLGQADKTSWDQVGA